MKILQPFKFGILIIASIITLPSFGTTSYTTIHANGNHQVPVHCYGPERKSLKDQSLCDKKAKSFKEDREKLTIDALRCKDSHAIAADVIELTFNVSHGIVRCEYGFGTLPIIIK